MHVSIVIWARFGWNTASDTDVGLPATALTFRTVLVMTASVDQATVITIYDRKVATDKVRYPRIDDETRICS